MDFYVEFKYFCICHGSIIIPKDAVIRKIKNDIAIADGRRVNFASQQNWTYRKGDFFP